MALDKATLDQIAMKVAFIGRGNMGKPMAANIAKSGHERVVLDADANRAVQVAAAVIVTMLPDAHSVRQVVIGTGGISSIAPPGTILVDRSSSQPLITRETGEVLAMHGISLIDAPDPGVHGKHLTRNWRCAGIPSAVEARAALETVLGA
jgi:3-hydroxyisobutyrate dehydrogenase